MEELTDFAGYRYFLIQSDAIFIFNPGSVEVDEEITCITHESSFVGFILFGYKKKDMTYALMDIVHNPVRHGYEEMIWRNRRTLLTTLLGMTIYPHTEDLYDRVLTFHLSDYIYEDKHMTLTDPLSLRVFNNINSVYSNNLFVD